MSSTSRNNETQFEIVGEIEQEEDLWTVWGTFKLALSDIHNDFNEWYWLNVLTKAILRHVIRNTPVGIVSIIRRLKQGAAALLPLLAISLIIFVCYSYTWLRHILVGKSAGAVRVSVHDFGVAYFCIMILFHFTHSAFRSPGIVVVPAPRIAPDSDHKTTDVSASITTASTNSYFPSPEPSFCKKCSTTRPPRAHHCSTCNKCILQMDHHCIWVNNCIGLKNYRSFFLTVTYLTLGCWYGILLSAKPIYDMWTQHIHKQQMETTTKLQILTELSRFLQMPLSFRLMGTIIRQSRHADPYTILKIVFVIMVAFASFLTPLLYTHLYCVYSAKTTLERLIDMDRLQNTILFTWKKHNHQSLTVNHSTTSKQINPFDRGWKQNIKQMIGEPLYYALLPIYIPPSVHPNTIQDVKMD